MKNPNLKKLGLFFVMVLIPTLIGIASGVFVKTNIGYSAYFIFPIIFVLAGLLSMFEKPVEIVCIIAITIVILRQAFSFLISLFKAQNTQEWTFHISILLVFGIGLLLFKFTKKKES